MAEQRRDRKVYEVTCGDGTRGRVSASSPEAAQQMAGEMCDVHDGVKDEPKAQG